MLKRSKRYISVLVAAVMLLSAMSFTAVAEAKDSSMLSVIGDSITEFNIEDVEFIEEIYGTGEVLFFDDGSASTASAVNGTSGATNNSSIQSTFNSPVNYFDTGVRILTANDAVHFWQFTVPAGGRTFAVTFASTHSATVAWLGTVSGGQWTSSSLQLVNGNTVWFELQAGTYAWAMLNLGGVINTQYRFISNGWNPGGAIAIEWVTNNLVEVAFRYPNGIIRVNGVIYNPPPPFNPVTFSQNFRNTLPLISTLGNSPCYERIFRSPNNVPITYDITARLWLSQAGLNGNGGLGTYSSGFAPCCNTNSSVVWMDLDAFPPFGTVVSRFTGSFFEYHTNGSGSFRDWIQGENTIGTIVVCVNHSRIIDWLGFDNIFNLYGHSASRNFRRTAGTEFNF
jgi:hypothetical protein